MHAKEYHVLCQLIVTVSQLRARMLAPETMDTLSFEQCHEQERELTKILHDAGITEATIALIGRVYTSGALTLSNMRST